jgi:hypothetical protein
MDQRNLSIFSKLVIGTFFVPLASYGGPTLGSPIATVSAYDGPTVVCDVASFQGQITLKNISSVRLAQATAGSPDDKVEITGSSAVLSPSGLAAVTVNAPVIIRYLMPRQSGDDFTNRRVTFATAAFRFGQLGLSLQRNIVFTENTSNGGVFFRADAGLMPAIIQKLDSSGNTNGSTSQISPCLIEIKKNGEQTADGLLRPAGDAMVQ